MAHPPGLDVFIAWFGAAAYNAGRGTCAQIARTAAFLSKLPPVEMKFGKALNLADRLGARYAVIVGDEELAANVHGEAPGRRRSEETYGGGFARVSA